MFKKYERMIKSLTNDYFPIKEDAEDAQQEIYLKLLTMEAKPPEEGEEAWMYVVIENACKDMYRAAKRRQAYDLGDNESVDYNDPSDYYASDELAIAIEEGYEDLEGIPKDMIDMRYLDDLDYKAMAEKMGVPVGTVASRLMRAKHLLSLGD